MKLVMDIGCAGRKGYVRMDGILLYERSRQVERELEGNRSGGWGIYWSVCVLFMKASTVQVRPIWGRWALQLNTFTVFAPHIFVNLPFVSIPWIFAELRGTGAKAMSCGPDSGGGVKAQGHIRIHPGLPCSWCWLRPGLRHIPPQTCKCHRWMWGCEGDVIQVKEWSVWWDICHQL